MNLLTTVRNVFAPAIVAVGADPVKVPDFLGMVKPSSNSEHGDYQANFAMSLAKVLGKKPQELANQVISVLKSDLVESVSVAGPGFINVKLKGEFLANAVRSIAGDSRLSIDTATRPKRFVID
ncbi:MAG TPA: hypothetical protein VGJ05_12680, partial [Fimbriiglobus sp.]